MEHEIKIQMLVEQVAVLDDTGAFEKLFYLYNKKLQRFAYCILKDTQVAEDTVSDVFVNLWRNRGKLLEIENLNNYLYISTKNIAIRNNVRLNRNRHVEISDMQLDAEKIQKTPEEILLNNELIRKYEAAVASLPTKCQTIYRLAKQDGLRYKEIAAILNVSVKTIDAQLAIAVKRITQSVKFVYNVN